MPIPLVGVDAHIDPRSIPPHFFLHEQKETGWSLKERYAKGGCGPPFGNPQRLTLAVKLAWCYRVTAHPCIQRWQSSGANASGSRTETVVQPFGWACVAGRGAASPSSVGSADSFPQRGKPWVGAIRGRERVHSDVSASSVSSARSAALRSSPMSARSVSSCSAPRPGASVRPSI